MHRHLCLAHLTVSLAATMIFATDGRSESDAFRVIQIVPTDSYLGVEVAASADAAHPAPNFTAQAQVNLEKALEDAWVARAELNALRVFREAEEAKAAPARPSAPRAAAPERRVTYYRVKAEDPFTYHPATRRTYTTQPPKFYKTRAPRVYKTRAPRTYQPVKDRQFQSRARYDAYIIPVQQRPVE